MCWLRFLPKCPPVSGTKKEQVSELKRKPAAALELSRVRSRSMLFLRSYGTWKEYEFIPSFPMEFGNEAFGLPASVAAFASLRETLPQYINHR